VEFEEMFPEQCGYILQDLCDKKDYGSFSVNEFNRRLSFFRSEFYEYNKKDILEEDRKNEISKAKGEFIMTDNDSLLPGKKDIERFTFHSLIDMPGYKQAELDYFIELVEKAIELGLINKNGDEIL
jgi:hypothetical protein